MTARELYDEKVTAYRAAAIRLARRDRTVAMARVLVAIAGVITLFIEPLAGLALLAGFVALAIWHERTIRDRRRAENAARFYERGIDRLSNSWTGKGAPGFEYIEEHHPYSGDLDLFGRGSVFELLCIAATHTGQARLASWLRAPAASADEIVARQGAVAELRDESALREEMAIVAAEVTAEIEHGRIEQWSQLPPIEFAAWERWGALVLGGVAGILAALKIPSGVLDVGGVPHAVQVARIGWLANVPGWPLLIVIVIAALLARRMGARAATIVAGVERAEPALALLAQLLSVLEKREFRSPRLQALRARLDRSGEPASRQIERLRRLVALLDARRNQFFMPIGFLLLWTTNLAVAIERWRGKSGRDVTTWMDAVGEIEALSSFGAFAFENPTYAMPVVVAEGPLFDAKELGHPLIRSDRRVTNDLLLGGGLQLLVVSGSNMSGKSTMMRSAGLGAVLGLAGAPVCAESLRISPLRLGASIRINDSLQEGASRFYAEILRIRQVLELSRGDLPLLFLLDEILAGTNSHDRRIGAEAVVRGLVEHGAIGLVSTHDLALADIAESLAPRAKNVHFEDHLEEGRVAFDYRMRPGVVTKSNALALMRAVGIDV
jgi:hypothetical protein